MKNVYFLYCIVGMYVILSYSYLIKTFNILFYPILGLNYYELFLIYGSLPLVLLMLIFYKKRQEFNLPVVF